MKTEIKFLLLFIFLIFSFLFSISLGPEIYSPFNLSSLSSVEKSILLKIRLPRVFAGIIVGGGLSIAGAVFQAILKNPLAESYTLGISGGASLGIAIGMILGKTASVPFFAFIGALFSITIILLTSIKKKFSNPTIILLGVALNFIFSSFVLFLISIVRNEKFQSTLLFLLGNLSLFPENLLKVSAFFIILSSLYLIFSSRVLDILSIGEEKAATTGIDVEKEKKIFFFLCALITGFCVSLAGIIGFVGLIIPHISRFIFGSSNRKVLPVSFIIGSGFLIIADAISRTIIKPLEIPVGVITGFFGGVFFLFLLVKSKYQELW